MGVTPKVQADMALQGGRHYRGRGLGKLQSWKCVACDAVNTGPFVQGCTSCGAGKPGQQVRKPGDPLPKLGGEAMRGRNPDTAGRVTPPQPPGSPPPRRSLADQVRRAASAADVDYDEIERRMTRVLEQRLGGGFSPAERARLYDGLEILITLWEDGTIVPAGGLSLEHTRQLAQKVAPEEMEITDGGTESTTAAKRYIGNPEGDPAERSFTHGHPSTGDNPDAEYDAQPGVASRIHAESAVRPAPELLDADHRGDEGREDDAAGDGG